MNFLTPLNLFLFHTFLFKVCYVLGILLAHGGHNKQTKHTKVPTSMSLYFSGKKRIENVEDEVVATINGAYRADITEKVMSE